MLEPIAEQQWLFQVRYFSIDLVKFPTPDTIKNKSVDRSLSLLVAVSAGYVSDCCRQGHTYCIQIL